MKLLFVKRHLVYKDEKDPNWIAWLRSSITRHQIRKGQQNVAAADLSEL